ncbi:protein SPT2 homolog [Drosophila kikkawai]|uniref:Protein SPT2 homolog n=1 Tax=Drosophila kikkawai TaxID=30033 RepID=A0ABM4GGR5_DROKI
MTGHGREDAAAPGEYETVPAAPRKPSGSYQNDGNGGSIGTARGHTEEDGASEDGHSERGDNGSTREKADCAHAARDNRGRRTRPDSSTVSTPPVADDTALMRSCQRTLGTADRSGTTTRQPSTNGSRRPAAGATTQRPRSTDSTGPTTITITQPPGTTDSAGPPTRSSAQPRPADSADPTTISTGQ